MTREVGDKAMPKDDRDLNDRTTVPTVGGQKSGTEERRSVAGSLNWDRSSSDMGKRSGPRSRSSERSGWEDMNLGLGIFPHRHG